MWIKTISSYQTISSYHVTNGNDVSVHHSERRVIAGDAVYAATQALSAIRQNHPQPAKITNLVLTVSLALGPGKEPDG